MNVTGTLVSVDHNVTIQKQNGGTYQGSRMAYRDSNGALKEQNFTVQTLKFNAALKNQLDQLEVGKNFTMVKEKEGDFWNVKGIYAEGAAPPPNPSSTKSTTDAVSSPAPRSNYETPEERAQKQVYIIRQSAINAAIALAGVTKKTTNIKDILSTAKEFEAHVFGIEFDDGSMAGLKSNNLDEDID